MTNDTELNMPDVIYLARESTDIEPQLIFVSDGVKYVRADNPPVDVDYYMNKQEQSVMKKALMSSVKVCDPQPDQSEVIRDLAGALAFYTNCMEGWEPSKQESDACCRPITNDKGKRAYQALEKHAEAIKKAGE